MTQDVRAEKVGDRIFTQSPWAPNASVLAKSIPGSNWRKTEKVWSYPLSMQTCRDLRSVYGERLQIGRELWRWAEEQVKREKTLTNLGRSYDAVLDNVDKHSPKLASAMENRKYQKSGAAFIATSRSVLIADEPSLGKTATALAGIMEAGKWHGQHLVVAPSASLVPTWVRQVLEWTDDAETFALQGTRAKREKMLAEFHASQAPTKFLIINFEMLQTRIEEFCKVCDRFVHTLSYDELQQHKGLHTAKKSNLKKMIFKQDWPDIIADQWASVILDESHFILAAYKPSNVTQVVSGLKSLKLDEDGLRIALTGTPLRGKEERIWGTLDFLNAMPMGYWAWIESYFQLIDNGFGKTIGGLLADRKEDFYKSIDTVVLRRKKSEVRDDLPDNIFIDHWVEMSAKQGKAYKDFAQAGEVALESGLLSSQGVLSELTRLKQLSFGEWDIYRDDNGTHLKPLEKGTSPKLELLIQMLADRGVTGDKKTEWREEGSSHKYVIGSQFTQVLDYIERSLNAKGIETLKITGSVTGKKRDAAAKSFDQDPDGPRVILLQTRTGGVSIDLDTFCDEMFIMDETFIDDDQEQLRGRIDNRKGAPRPRTFHYIRTKDTVEDEISKSNVEQARIQAAMLDIRRGVQVKMRSISK